MKNVLNTNALLAGGASGVAAQFASGIPAIGAYARPIGFMAGAFIAKDAATKATANYLAGLSLGSTLIGGAGVGSGGGVL